ncbi:hypothetical protein [Leptolyngbya ohadii]|nr:hypothetical protein [Leptolyngbya ohadii]
MKRTQVGRAYHEFKLRSLLPSRLMDSEQDGIAAADLEQAIDQHDPDRI